MNELSFRKFKGCDGEITIMNRRLVEDQRVKPLFCCGIQLTVRT
eukprot:COSAG02_NODE_35393_length_469_cov_0.702703_1_plen_43_part_10